MSYRPRDEMLLKVIKYLESIGLEIMGPGVNLDSGEQFAANRNFNAKQTITYRRMYERNQFWRNEE